MKLVILLLSTFSISSVKSDLAKDFQDRVDNFIAANLASDTCDIWIDILRLEYGVEEHLCLESFINAVRASSNASLISEIPNHLISYF